MTLWTAAEAEAATGGRAVGNWTVSGVSIDTRTLQNGDLFVALKAARDAHDFVANALNAGAGAALVSRIPDGVADDAPMLIVDDVLRGLEDLGRAARARTDARVVAITGSVGKTSTKEMLREMLMPQGRTHAAEASYNNHWGVPLTLARMPRDTEFAVIEIGMNAPGEIGPLAQMARPHVAMVTTVAAVHLAAFDDINGIAHEKAAIFDGLVDGGVAVVNADLPTTDILLDAAKNASVLTFGERGATSLDDVSLTADTTIVQATHMGAPLLFKLATPGRHFAANALGALVAADAMGADIGRAVLALGQWSPFKGRGVRETITLDPAETQYTLELIDDAYNANPTSVAAGLEVLSVTPPKTGVGLVDAGRRIAILGDMLEMGDAENALHAGLADVAALDHIDLVHCVGLRMKHLWDALPPEKRGEWTATSHNLAAGITDIVDAGDVILVKGSLGSRMAVIVDAIRKLGHSTPNTN